MKVKYSFYFSFEVPLYRVTVVVFTEGGLKRFNKHLKIQGFHEPDMNEDVEARLLINENCPLFGIQLSWFSGKPECWGTLQHEIFHLTHRILERADVPFSSENHEPFAYLNSYLTEEIYRRILK